MRRQVLDLNVEDFISAYVIINDSRIHGLVGSQWKEGIMGRSPAISMMPGTDQ